MRYVNVNPVLLRWARERAGVDIATLNSKFPKIKEWESGEAKPTFRQLENLAKATSMPFGFFFLPEPLHEEYPIRHFRTLDDEAPAKLSLDLLDTIHLMQRRQDWMREYLIEQGNPRLDFVASAGREDSIAIVVAKMRRALNISMEWAQTHASWEEALRALRDHIENAGIFVVVNGIVENNTHRTLSVDDFRGFVLVDEYAPFIFVNNADSQAAQMFTLAHELAHVLYGRSASFDLAGGQPAQEPSEQMCNKAAAEFLVPETRLRRLWPKMKNTPGCYVAIARTFKVSTLVVARRLLDVQLITRNDFLEFYNDLMHAEQTQTDATSGGGDFYKNQNLRVGKRFASAVVGAVRSGEMPYTEAYRLTGLWGNTFENYAASLGRG